MAHSVKKYVPPIVWKSLERTVIVLNTPGKTPGALIFISTGAVHILQKSQNTAVNITHRSDTVKPETSSCYFEK